MRPHISNILWSSASICALCTKYRAMNHKWVFITLANSHVHSFKLSVCARARILRNPTYNLWITDILSEWILWSVACLYGWNWWILHVSIAAIACNPPFYSQNYIVPEWVIFSEKKIRERKKPTGDWINSNTFFVVLGFMSEILALNMKFFSCVCSFYTWWMNTGKQFSKLMFSCVFFLVQLEKCSEHEVVFFSLNFEQIRRFRYANRKPSIKSCYLLTASTFAAPLEYFKFFVRFFFVRSFDDVAVSRIISVHIKHLCEKKCIPSFSLWACVCAP